MELRLFLWLATFQQINLSLFCKYMTAKRMMQRKSLVWGIWKSNGNRMILALTIRCCKPVVTSWLWGSGKCHNIHNIFTNSLLQSGLFVPSPFIWMKELWKGLVWFLQMIYFSYPFYTITQGFWEEEKALAAYTCWDRISKSKVFSTLWEPSPWLRANHLNLVS